MDRHRAVAQKQGSLFRYGLVIERVPSQSFLPPQQAFGVEDHVSGVQSHGQEQHQVADHLGPLFDHHSLGAGLWQDPAELGHHSHRVAGRGGNKARGGKPALAHIDQKPRAHRPEEEEIDGHPPDRPVAQHPGAGDEDHHLLEPLVEAGGLVDAQEEPAGGGPEPDAVASGVIVRPMPSDGEHEDRSQAGQGQCDRREPDGQASLAVQVEGGDPAIGGQGSQPRHPHIEAFQPGDHRQAGQQHNEKCRQTSGDQIGQARLFVHEGRIPVVLGSPWSSRFPLPGPPVWAAVGRGRGNAARQGVAQYPAAPVVALATSAKLHVSPCGAQAPVGMRMIT